MNVLRKLVIAAVLVLAAGPAWGYIVFLKDGKQIITKEKYRREGETVHLVMQNGVRSTLAASEVDFKKTDEINKDNVGGALILEGGETKPLQRPQTEEPRQPTLSDLAASRTLSMPEVRRREDPVTETETELPYTRAGFVDLTRLPRLPLDDAEITGELTQYFESQGLEGFEIFRGSATDRPLVVVVTNTDTAVFKALKDSASALVQTQARFPERLGALEVLMMTEGKVRAGQFVLTPDLAKQLVAGLDARTFFTRYVEF